MENEIVECGYCEGKVPIETCHSRNVFVQIDETKPYCPISYEIVIDCDICDTCFNVLVEKAKQDYREIVCKGCTENDKPCMRSINLEEGGVTL